MTEIASLTANDDDMAQLGDLIRRARVVLPFTGAGISTECGIPDFRSPGGLWSQNAPIPFDAFLSSQDMRNEAWRRRLAMDSCFAAAKPGRGHRALARLYHAAKAPGVVTQNIDNLHQLSGVDGEHVIELHGNTTYAGCLDCGQRYEIVWVRERFTASAGVAPDCPACGGPIKTATVSFGQPMPDAAMHRAAEWAEHADLVIAIGSSLVVWPAAGIPLVAQRAGARFVIINREPTPLDDAADLVIRADIGETLERVLAM